MGRKLLLANKPLLAFLGLGFLIRLALIPHPGFLADIAYWKWWASSAAEEGLAATLTQTGINYPPLYLYFLKATGHLYQLFGSFDDPGFWDQSNYLFLLLIKLPYILADLGIAYLIYRLLSSWPALAKKSLSLISYRLSLPVAAAALFLLHPVVVYNSAIWGQTDSIGAFLVLAAVLSAFNRRVWLAGALTALAFFFKVQTVIFIPLIGLYLFQKEGLSKTLEAAMAGLGAALVANLPYLAADVFDHVAGIMLGSVGFFPFVSLNAYNLGWLLIQGSSDKFFEGTLIAGLISYKMASFILLGGATLLGLAYLWFRVRPWPGSDPKGNGPSKEAFLEAATFASLAFFMLPTQIHERYLFPFFVFATPLIFLRRSLLRLAYAVFSVSALLNLHLVMIKNYPENSLPIFPFAYNRELTVVLAAVNLVIFGYLTWRLAQGLPRRAWGAIFALTAILLLLFPLVTRAGAGGKTVWLTDIKPTSASQGYGTLGIDKSVDGRLLSSAFYFYDKGFGTHANSHLAFDLGGRYTRFATDYGVDTEAPDAASVEFKIIVDGLLVFESGVMKKWDGPRHAEVDITGSNHLELVVTDAGDGINSDHADWLNPKLYR